MGDDLTYLDYFTGGVPAGALFALNMSNIHRLLNASPTSRSRSLDSTAELCLIGLLAYFEAFCRDHFASLVNICPQLVKELKRRGREVSIDGTTLLMFRVDPARKLGFLLAERYEFGTAKAVNSVYHDLLLVTPFSDDERKRYEKLLNDRNLLVHHGGIYTVRYAGQTFVRRRTRQRVFFDSLVVKRHTVRSAAKFLEGVAEKTMRATHGALEKYIRQNKIRTSGEEKKAIYGLLWWQ